MSNNKQKSNFKLYAGIASFIVLLEIITGILGELMPDSFKKIFTDFLENTTGFSYDKAYLILFAVILLLLLVLFLVSQYLERRSDKPLTPQTASNQEREKYINDLKIRYQNRYDQKIDQRIPVELRLIYDQTGTTEDYSEKYFTDTAKQQIPINEKLYNVLKTNNHLLITGEPGAGKTTLIIGLAQEILLQENTPDAPMPIIVNLAPWKLKTGETFAQWLASALNSGYGFSKAYAKQAIDNQLILPLFDGLDEVGRNSEQPDSVRADCLKAITTFIEKKNITRFVICSRIKEYIATANNAPVKAQIFISPLSLLQIQTELETIKHKPLDPNQKKAVKNQIAAQNVLPLLDKNPALQTVLQTPFYFNIGLEVLDQKIPKIDLPQTPTELETFLVQAFIDQKINNTLNKRQFTKEKSLKYLAWLAHLMNTNSLVVFELADLQPTMLRKSWRFGLVGGLVVGLVGGLVVGLVEEIFTVSTYSTIQHSYHRLKSDWFFNLFQYSFIGCLLFLGMSFYNQNTPIEILLEGLKGLFVGGTLSILTSSLLQHALLRLCFTYEKTLPIRFADFLEYGTAARLLEQDGGHWRFRHQILQDYFDELHQQGNVKPKTP